MSQTPCVGVWLEGMWVLWVVGLWLPGASGGRPLSLVVVSTPPEHASPVSPADVCEGGGVADPLGAREIAHRTLSAWAADPSRMQEDWAAESELASVAHSGRLLVELIQNAADAVPDGESGELMIRVTGLRDRARHSMCEGMDQPVLEVSNTGRALDARGLASMASLRTSTKTDAAGDAADSQTGRFGVGFAAVLAACETPYVASAGAAVVFDAARTRTLMASQPLGEDSPVPADRLPVLRVPHQVDGDAREGYATSIVLPLSDSGVDAVTAMLADLDDWVLLAFPQLSRINIVTENAAGECETREIAHVESRWWLLRREVELDAEAVAKLPRTRSDMKTARVAVAIPRTPLSPREVAELDLLAPTPTSLSLPWPLRVVADLPTDESRRAVIDGPVTDAVLDATAAAVVELLTRLAGQGHKALDYLPTIPASTPVDETLRDKTLRAFRTSPTMLAVQGPGELGAVEVISPRDAVALDTMDDMDDSELLSWLTLSTAGLVSTARRHGDILRTLNIERISVHDAVSGLNLPQDITMRNNIWDMFAARLSRPSIKSAIATLDVPLASGTTRSSARGVIIPTELPDPVRDLLIIAGAPILAAGAAQSESAVACYHAAGAETLTVAEALARSEVSSWVELLTEEIADGDVLFESARAKAPTWQDASKVLLGAVQSAVEDRRRDTFAVGHAALPSWLSDIPVPDEAGEPCPASVAVLPGGQLARLLDEGVAGVVHADWAYAFHEATWEAVGTHKELTRVDLPQCDVVDLADLAMDGVELWAALLPAGVVESGAYVAGLDVVDEDHLDEALRAVMESPSLAAAVAQPVVVRGYDGATHKAPSHTAWWLATCDTGLENVLATVEAAAVPGDGAQRGCHEALLEALRSAAAADCSMSGAAYLLETSMDAAPTQCDIVELWQSVASELRRGADIPLPEAVWALDSEEGPVLVSPDLAWVPTSVMWAQRVDIGPMVPAPMDAALTVSDWLGVEMPNSSSEQIDVTGTVSHVVPQELASWCGIGTWSEHEELTVDGAPVAWWVEHVEDESGEAPPRVQVHAVSTAYAADALAYAAGTWAARDVMRSLLEGESFPVTELVQWGLKSPLQSEGE